MRRISFWGILVFIGLFLSACSTTKVTGVWRDDAYAGKPRKAMVVLATNQPTVKRLFEDEFAKQLKARAVDAVPGYSLLPPDRPLDDKEEVAAAAEKINADTLFITRLVDQKTYETYYPGSVYTSPAGGYGPGWRNYYSGGYNSYHATPGYTVQESILYVETQLYDAKTEQLIWSVMTETRVGSSMESEVKSFVKVIMKNLSEKRLVANP